MKRPAFQFYPADWKKDPALSLCSITARGLWIELMCIAHESEDYGKLTVNGSAMTDTQISRLVGESLPVVRKALKELEDAGVFSRDASGAIFSRRMVRDETVRNRRAEGGEGGKEFGHLGAEHGRKGGRPRKPRGVLEAPLNPPPSSSSSSSSSENTPLPPFDSVDATPSCTLEQAKAYGGMVRMTPDEAEHWWHSRNASGWTKSSAGGHPRRITSWQSDMAASVQWVRQAVATAANGGEKPKPAPRL